MYLPFTRSSCSASVPYVWISVSWISFRRCFASSVLSEACLIFLYSFTSLWTSLAALSDSSAVWLSSFAFWFKSFVLSFSSSTSSAALEADKANPVSTVASIPTAAATIPAGFRLIAVLSAICLTVAASSLPLSRAYIASWIVSCPFWAAVFTAANSWAVPSSLTCRIAVCQLWITLVIIAAVLNAINAAVTPVIAVVISFIFFKSRVSVPETKFPTETTISFKSPFWATSEIVSAASLIDGISFSPIGSISRSICRLTFSSELLRLL